MAKLIDLAAMLRSKNAGPLYMTFDVMFDGPEMYEKVKNSGVLTKERISSIYGAPRETIQIIYYDIVSSLKITIPRKHISGALEDDDIYGCQQQGPLACVEIGL